VVSAESIQPRKKRARATKHTFTLWDNHVAVVRRTPEGKAVVVHLDHDGRPIGCTTEAWPDELCGVGWHHGGIKRLLERLPLQGAPLNPAPDGEIGFGVEERGQTVTPARRSSPKNSSTKR
jgi:hypothetical protein